MAGKRAGRSPLPIQYAAAAGDMADVGVAGQFQLTYLMLAGVVR
jgi:hypothetical protein